VLAGLGLEARDREQIEPYLEPKRRANIKLVGLLCPITKKEKGQLLALL